MSHYCSSHLPNYLIVGYKLHYIETMIFFMFEILASFMILSLTSKTCIKFHIEIKYIARDNDVFTQRVFKNIKYVEQNSVLELLLSSAH